MRRKLVNYSTIVKKDRKLYNVGFEIPGGVSLSLLKIVLPIFSFIVFIGFILSKFLNIEMFNILEDNFNFNYLIIVVMIAIIVSSSFYFIKFAGYRLYEYLLAYLRPKRVITNQTQLDGKPVRKEKTLTNIKIETVIRNEV